MSQYRRTRRGLTSRQTRALVIVVIFLLSIGCGALTCSLGIQFVEWLGASFTNILAWASEASMTEVAMAIFLTLFVLYILGKLLNWFITTVLVAIFTAAR